MDPDRPAHPDLDEAALALLRDGAVTDTAQQVRNRLALGRFAQCDLRDGAGDVDAMLFWLFTGSTGPVAWPVQDGHLGTDRVELRSAAIELILDQPTALRPRTVALCAALEAWVYAPELRQLPSSAGAA